MASTEVRYLVLDKDFFQGCPRDVESIAHAGTRFIVIEETYMEVGTTDNLREQLLRRLHGLSEHIDLLHIGALFKYEIDNQRPCWPVTEHFQRGVLNPNFTFPFTDQQTKVLEEKRDYVEYHSANQFLQIVKEIQAKTGKFERGDICRADAVREVYASLRSSRWPPAELLDERWAIYRKVQVDWLAALDYLQNYDGTEFLRSAKTRAHDQIDFWVCVVGALVGGLATRDEKTVARYFRTICPTGRLVQCTC